MALAPSGRSLVSSCTNSVLEGMGQAPRFAMEFVGPEVSPITSVGVQLTGVALVEGQALAFVSHNGDSGPVAVGDRGGVGGSRKPWLPRDWAVQAIDVGAGTLRLQGPPPRRAALTVQL